MSSSSKRAPQPKPRTLKAQSEKQQVARAAAVKAEGQRLERHDAERSVRTKVATDKRRNGKKLGQGERAYPGRLTKEGRSGAKVVRTKTVSFDPGRARALEDYARARTIEAGKRITESQIVAEALARFGVGGKSLQTSEGA